MKSALEQLHSVVLRTHATLVYGPVAADRTTMLICSALGLAGEAGEYVDLAKKTYEQARVFDREKAIKELGDVLYYVQLAAMALDTDLPHIVDVLEGKLAKRYPHGFTHADSMTRTDMATTFPGADGGAGS